MCDSAHSQTPNFLINESLVFEHKSLVAFAGRFCGICGAILWHFWGACFRYIIGVLLTAYTLFECRYREDMLSVPRSKTLAFSILIN